MSPRCRDVTSNAGLPTGANFPTRDEEGNVLETQYGESRFRDQQVRTATVPPLVDSASHASRPHNACEPAAQAVLSTA